MSGLAIKDITKRFGDFTAVDAINLSVPHGTFVCLLGPSGCGKTTLLRMIAGLEEPTSGAILLDDQDITPMPTHKRNLGMVFQSLALFPHLSVGDNIAYALRIRGASREEQAKRVDELLKMVHLPGFADRPVAKLSGGQRQRVAIARALALSPKLFLLDEPLSALDAKLREAMQVELRQLQQQLGITTIVVTHDQREAMTMADLVVVMGNGKIRQAAAPIEIYRKPADAFVADFIGSTNLLDVTADSAGRADHSRPSGCRALAAGRRFQGIGLDPAGRRAYRGARRRYHLGNGDLRARPRRHHRDLRRGRRVDHRRGGDAARTAQRRCRADSRPRAAAGKLRGAGGMRREAPKSIADYTPLFFPAVMLIVFFVVPFSTMIAVSFFKRDPAGFYTTDFVWENYARFLSTFFASVLGFSLMLAIAGGGLLHRRGIPLHLSADPSGRAACRRSGWSACCPSCRCPK